MTPLLAGAGRSVTDLRLLVALTVAAAAALLVPGVPWPLEWALGVPFLLVAPGYAVVAALFPTAPARGPLGSGRQGPPGWAARGAIALVLSAVLTATLAVQLSRLALIRVGPVILSLAAVTLLGAAVAWLRRRHVPAHHSGDPIVAASGASLPDRLALSTVQTAVLAVAVLALVGSLAFAGATPTQDEGYTEVALLDGEGGEVLGADRSVTLVAGEPNPVYLRLENHEGQATTYGVVAMLQRVDEEGAVVASERVDSGQIRVADGETVGSERTITPTATGDALRLRYLVYTGAVPDNPGPDSADLTLRLWVDVSPGAGT